MKFATVALALAAAVSAQAPPPNFEAIIAAMPNDLIAVMTYFPSSFIQGVFAGAALPTDVSALFALAPGIPMADRPKLESEYLQFLAQIAPLMPTPTKASSSTPTSTPKTTATPTSASSHSGSHSNSGSSSGASSDSGSSKAESSSGSDKESDSSDSSDSESESESDSSESSKNGAAKVAVSFVAAVALAAGAMF
ncbi:hypothetical protein IWW37_003211 [Coemansia sp. RSA 2050]|nr:hypothetical protein IWW37_003211 [Coemansia sp. RSA 2050]KAJ2733127.1 hypothetical protein IW152_003284 [Coemansia sp. BCRC 34962]